MYICLCKGITDKQLEEAQKNSKSFRDVCKSLGLGTDCGACVREAIDVMNKFNQKSDKANYASPKQSNT